MKKKGFTLVELLVVIAIIALLMGILMPALARVRQIAYRLYCGTNLSGIGKAILIYANDYDGELPKAGLATGASLGPIALWSAPDRNTAFGGGRGSTASISSCFYLLIRYAEVTPKSFLCKGDSGVTNFKPSDFTGGATLETINCWDFGPTNVPLHVPQMHCSYSYHHPFGPYSLTATSDPGLALAADPNPWQQTGSGVGSGKGSADWGAFNPLGDREAIKHGSAQTHQDDGQNVLFTDGHTSFEKSPSCGIDDDNIYTIWGGTPLKMRGQVPSPRTQVPVQRSDSFLVTDGIPTASTTVR